jgi:hypothetical protein
MDPTLTLTIPLTLLSRTDVLDPSTHFPTTARPTLPLTYLHATLAKYCPEISIHLHIPAPSSDKQGSEKDNEEAREDGESWILSPSLSPSPHALTLLSSNVCPCAFTLRRTRIPLLTTSLSHHIFVRELMSIFTLLRAMHNLCGPWDTIANGRDVRLWSIFAPVDVPLEISVRPGVGDGLDGEMVQKLVMLVVGVEREMLGCSMVGRGVVSSWVEGLVVKGVGNGNGDVEGRIRRTWGRRGEWFDIVRSTDLGSLLRELGNAEDEVGVACAFNDDGRVRSVSLKMHAATFEVQEILWYTALSAALTATAYELDVDGCVEWLEEYRENAPSPFSLTCLAKALRIPAPPTSYLPDQNANFEMVEEEDVIANPFWKFETNIEKESARQRAYIPVFVERYEEAGGFWPTGEEKIEALRRAEGWRKLKEENDRKKKKRSRGDGSGVEEVQGDSDGDGAETLEFGERNEGWEARVLYWMD